MIPWIACPIKGHDRTETAKSARIGDATAHAAGDVLILSLPGALSPVVWRLALESSGASAIEVREAGEGDVRLIQKTAGEDIREIARFTERAPAVDALNAVTQALEMGLRAQIRSQACSDAKQVIQAAPGQDNAPPVTAAPRRRMYLAMILAAALVLAVSVYLMGAGSVQRYTPPVAAQSGGGGGGAAPGEGMPMSADEFLKRN